VRCPLLAVFGADDVFVPVEASVAAFEQAGHRAVVFPGGDHRVMTLDPATGQRRRAPGLFELIVSWLTETLGRRASG
jgi:pimeloyl-ACP methyl ester carboxylesterase